MIWPSVLVLPVDTLSDPAGRQPIEDPLPDGAPVIDDPEREVPAVDPRRRDAPEPVREPRREPPAEPIPH